MSLYAADGSFNVTIVDGTTYTGLYAADGSYNVVVNDGTTYTGILHSCGALNVVIATVDTPVGYYAPNGSMYVAETPYNPAGVTGVTVVSGDLTPGGGGGPTEGTPMGLLLALTYAA